MPRCIRATRQQLTDGYSRVPDPPGGFAVHIPKETPVGIEGCGEPAVIATQPGTRAFNLTAERLNSFENRLKVLDLHVQSGTRARRRAALRTLESS